MSQPGFPDVGTLLYNGLVNGQLVWTQPDGPGTQVFPKAPSQFPARNLGYPQNLFAYQGLYSLGCGHWINSVEEIIQYDPYSDMQAALLCCPLCHYIQEIIEPARDWKMKYYGLYPTGLSIATLPPGQV